MTKTQKPNFTQIPNSILESMSQFSESELKVILFFCRQTFGWQREKSVASISFISNGTGISKRSVVSACESLEQKGLLEKSKTDQFGGANRFELTIDDLCKIVTSENSALCKIVTAASANSDALAVQNLHTNKESIKKESMKEIKEASPEVHEATALWIQAYNEMNSHPYKPTSDKKGMAVERAGMEELIRIGNTPEKIGEIARAMFAYTMPPGKTFSWCHNCRSIGKFIKWYNDIQAELTTAEAGKPSMTKDERDLKAYNDQIIEDAFGPSKVSPKT